MTTELRATICCTCADSTVAVGQDCRSRGFMSHLMQALRHPPRGSGHSDMAYLNANIRARLAIGQNGANFYMQYRRAAESPCIAAQLVPTAQTDLPFCTRIGLNHFFPPCDTVAHLFLVSWHHGRDDSSHQLHQQTRCASWS